MIQENEPWKLVKEDKEKCGQVLCLSANIAKNIVLLLNPILPSASLKLSEQLNMESMSFENLKTPIQNVKLGKAKILITTIEKPKEAEKFPADLKVAKVESVKDHPNADKLYVLKVSVGSEQRQIVAGLKETHSKEDLVNSNIIIVTNLKPAKIRGEESNGMLLAAESDEVPAVLLQAEKATSGDSVEVEGMIVDSSKITVGKISQSWTCRER